MSRDYNLDHPYHETLKHAMDLYSTEEFNLSEEVMPSFASKINPHKVFHLMKFSGGLGDLSSIDSEEATKEDWRDKGQLLDLKKYTDSKHNTFTEKEGDDGSEFNAAKINSGPSNVAVSPQVHLFLEAKSLEFEMTNTFDKPIAKLLDKLVNSTVGKVANDGLAVIAGAQALAATDSKAGDALKSIQQSLDPVANSQKFMLKFKNIPAWIGTENLSVPGSLTFKFSFGQAGLFDAAEEVVRPILALAMYFAPIDNRLKDGTFDGTIDGILPTEAYVKIRGAIAVAEGATSAVSTLMEGNGILNAVSSVYKAIDGSLAETYSESRGCEPTGTPLSRGQVPGVRDDQYV